MFPWKGLATVLAISTMAAVALAKGNFQARGLVSDVQKNGDEVSFRFVGRIELVYASAPMDPQAPQKLIELESAGVPIRLSGWTRRHDPATVDEHFDVEPIYTTLISLARSGRTVALSVDNPSLTFSNSGSVVSISGTYVYAQEVGK